MNAHQQERIAKLLKKSLPPVGNQPAAELKRDLWPAMLRRLQERPLVAPWFEQVWFDWALLGSAAALLAFFPGVIPVLLYHL
jgi:hypothetical protein